MNGARAPPQRVAELTPTVLDGLNNNTQWPVATLQHIRGGEVIKIEAAEVNLFIADMLGIDHSFFAMPEGGRWKQSRTPFSPTSEEVMALRAVRGRARVMNKMKYSYRTSSQIAFNRALCIYVWRVLHVDVSKLAEGGWRFPRPHEQSDVYPVTEQYTFLMVDAANVAAVLEAVNLWRAYRPNPAPANNIVVMDYWQLRATQLEEHLRAHQEHIATLEREREDNHQEMARLRDMMGRLQRKVEHMRMRDAIFGGPILPDDDDDDDTFSGSLITGFRGEDSDDEDLAWRARTFSQLLQALYAQEGGAEAKKPFVLGVTAEHGGGQQSIPADHASTRVQHDHKYVVSLDNQGDTDLYLTVVVHTATSKGSVASYGEDLHWIELEAGEFSPWLTVGGVDVDMRTEVDDSSFAISLADMKERGGGDLKAAMLQCFVVEGPTAGHSTPHVWRWDAKFLLQ